MKKRKLGLCLLISGCLLMPCCFLTACSQGQEAQTTKNALQEAVSQKVDEIVGIQVPHDSESYPGQNKTDVENELKEAGFTDISFEEIKGVGIVEGAEVDGVAKITIGDQDTFKEGSRFPEETPVLISYYTLAEFRADLYLDMKSNLLFNKYESDLYIDGEEYQHLVQGTDFSEKLTLTYGEHKLTLVNSKDDTIKGQIDLKVDSNLDLYYIVKCKKDKIELTESYNYRIIRPLVTFGRKDNGDPIVWQVLEEKDGEALLISYELISFEKFYPSSQNMTWERSNIRIWLNEHFYHNSFLEEERSYIHTKTITTADNPEYGTYGGKETEDNIFLLSAEEAEQYFENNGDRRAVRTPNSWWLRTMGKTDSRACIVYKDGGINYKGDGVNDIMVGARPAMWVDASLLR